MRKNIFAGLMLGAYIAMATGCSSEAPLGGEENKLQLGEPSFATFNVFINTGDTRAGDDENADAVEQKISEINFFIFSGGILEKIHKHIVTEQADPVPVSISTGTKTVYAVTTGILDDNEIIEERTTSASDFEKILVSALCDDRTEGGVNIAKQNKFLMIGKQTQVYITKCTDEEAAIENAVKIGVDRAAAKVQVIYPDNSTSPEVENTAVKIAQSVNAAFTYPEFDVAQTAKRMYLRIDPNNSNPSLRTYSPIVYDESTGRYDGINPVSSDKMDFIQAPKSANADYECNKYAGECVTQTPVTGNSTFAVVRLTCKPKAIYEGKTLTEGTFFVLAHTYEDTGTWSFLTGDDRKMLYFASADDAEAYKAERGEVLSAYHVYEYTNGICYYRIDLVHDKDTPDGTELHKIMRNNYYRANVTKIDALGSPNVEGLVPGNPDTPIEKDSYLSAEIIVKPWTVHGWDTTLE